MDIKKALIASVIGYAVTFLVASGLLFMQAQNAMLFSVMVTLFALVLTFVIAKFYYFKGMVMTSFLKEGLLFGILYDVVMIVIDIPVMVYGFAVAQGWSYILSLEMFAGYALTIVVCLIAAYLSKEKTKK